MKKLFYLLLVAITLTNCKSEKPKKLGDRKVLAGWIDSAGVKTIEVLLERVIDTIQRDSGGAKSKIVRATIWGVPFYDSIRDRSGKPIIDSITKKARIGIATYIVIPTENVFIDIANKDYDSLMKPRKK